jgi:TRAP-type mannitol/chloroaromatic compound transport system permease small subunit
MREFIIRAIDRIGKLVGPLILVITFIMTWEVVSRYAFNAPTTWVWMINRQLFGVFVLVAGSYALVHRNHIRIEMLYEHFPPRIKTIIRWLTLLAALIFLGSLFWKSGVMGLEAWKFKEKAVGVFKLPLYPLKLFIPVGAGLFILACLAVFTREERPGSTELPEEQS